MNGIVFDIRRYSVHDGPGIRSTVFLKGCPLRCFWCHNPESQATGITKIRKTETLDGKSTIADENVGYSISDQAVVNTILRDRLCYEESNGGVTFSGGEPLLQPDFLLSMLRMCHEEGIHTAVDTSGFASREIFTRVAEATNMLLLDIKTTHGNKHLEATGQNNKVIIENLKSLNNPNLQLIIRIPLIPGINDTREELSASLQLLQSIRQPVERVDILPFHRLGQHKYEALGLLPSPKLPNHHATPNTREAISLFNQAGFRVKEGG